MKVEVLYVAECPSHPAVVKLVRDVLNSEGVAEEVREALVRNESMARTLRSPALQRSASTGGTLWGSLRGRMCLP
jgi:hypothetical protein